MPTEDDRKRVSRVLALNAEEQKRFDEADFMGVPLRLLDGDDLRGLVVWVIRNRHYISDGFGLDAIPTRAR